MAKAETSFEPKFATYIGPSPDKGVFYFARILSELGRLRPDIPVQLVIGRGSEHWLDETGLELRLTPAAEGDTTAAAAGPSATDGGPVGNARPVNNRK